MNEVKFKDYKIIFRYIIKQKIKILWLILCMVTSQSCGLVLPRIMSKIVDVGIKNYGFDVDTDMVGLSLEQLVSHQNGYILLMGLQMIVVTIISAVFSVVSGRLMAKLSASISSEMRKDVFFKVLDMPSRKMDKMSVSSVITRATNDIEHVKSFLLTSVHILMPPFMALGGIYMVMITCAKMSWIMGLGSALAVVVAVICLRLSMPKMRLVQLLNDKFNMIVRERLAGLVVTRVFNNNKYECEKFQKCNREFMDIAFYVSKIFVFVMPAMSTIMNLVNVLIIWLGANEIAKTNMQVGDVMALMQYTVLVIMAFLMFSLIVSNIPKAWISVERVTEILNMSGCRKNKYVSAIPLRIQGRSIEFKNVGFRYDEAEDFALKDINFKAVSGQNIGFLGSMGCGKSTIFKLLLGEYNSTNGKVLIDGIDISEAERKSLTKIIGYVPQKTMLFEGTVAENIRLDNADITDDEIFKALKTVSLENLANKEGINRRIEQGGNNFSGGERQRLTLARAIVSDRDIYIFDDSFSKLDFRTDKRVREELLKVAKNSIVFMASQRISVLKECDKIIVLENGKITAIGTHKELLEKSEMYFKIANLQLGDNV